MHLNVTAHVTSPGIADSVSSRFVSSYEYSALCPLNALLYRILHQALAQ